MKSNLLLVAVVLTLVSLARAQDKHLAAKPNSSTNCSFTFGSGSGANATQYCVTNNGNIIQFSRPSGFEHLSSTQAEGYAVCDLNTNAAYYDYAAGGDSGWGSPTTTSTSTSVQVIRTSTDGVWTLTQTIKQVKASKSNAGSAAISMALKNNSAVKRIAYIYRYANVNADGFVNNNFFNAIDAGFALDTANYQGLELLNNSLSTGGGAYAQTVPTGPDPCNPANGANLPFVGDGSLVLVWPLISPAGTTKTVAMTYKPL